MDESTTLLLAVIAGVVAAAGLVLLIAAVRGIRPRRGRGGAARVQLTAGLVRRLTAAVLAGAAVLVLTRLPMAGLGCGLFVAGWPAIAGGAKEERTAMARLEALAAWTESLRDTIAGAVGLEQAIPASLRAVAPVLQPHVRLLVDRLHTRMPMPEALRRFGEDLDDSSADLVVAALMLNARLRGPGLRDMLGALSTSARAELDMRRRVEANRRTTRRSVQIVVGVSVATALVLALFNESFLAPYRSVLGQFVLALVVGLFALGFLWMRRLAKFELPARFLAADPATTAVRPAAADAPADSSAGQPLAKEAR
jgi:Flp pilus assembly protein TadB